MPGCESRSLSDSRSKMRGSPAANASSTFGRRRGPTSLRSHHGGPRAQTGPGSPTDATKLVNRHDRGGAPADSLRHPRDRGARSDDSILDLTIAADGARAPDRWPSWLARGDIALGEPASLQAVPVITSVVGWQATAGVTDCGISSGQRIGEQVGITASRVASRARSAQSRFGRRGCRRCRTASWWRRSRITAVFHDSFRRDSRSHDVIRVIRRKTNCRHMTGDHHGQTARRATLLVTAADEILGTHRYLGVAAMGSASQPPWEHKG